MGNAGQGAAVTDPRLPTDSTQLHDALPRFLRVVSSTFSSGSSIIARFRESLRRAAPTLGPCHLSASAAREIARKPPSHSHLPDASLPPRASPRSPQRVRLVLQNAASDARLQRQFGVYVDAPQPQQHTSTQACTAAAIARLATATAAQATRLPCASASIWSSALACLRQRSP